MNDFQTIWAELDAALDRRPRLGDVRRRLARTAWTQALSALGDAALLLWTGSFLYDHRAEPRFFAPALLLHLYLIASVVAQTAGFVLARGVDYEGPIATAQRRIAALALLRARLTQWTFLTAPLVWIPLLVVALRGLLRVDAYAFLDHAWLVANVAFGVLFIPVALWLSRRLEARFGRSRLVRIFAGSDLAAAVGFYSELAGFEEA